MGNVVAQRDLFFRRRGLPDSSPLSPVSVRVEQLEVAEPGSLTREFRCLVVTGPSPQVPNEVYGADQITTLLAALTVADNYCQMLSVLGELVDGAGYIYKPEIGGALAIVQHYVVKNRMPPFE